MDKKTLDRIVREEVASLLETVRSRTPGTTGHRDFVGGRSRDDIEGVDKTTGFSKPYRARPEKDWDEPFDPEEEREYRERMRAAREREDSERAAAHRAAQASQPRQKHVMTRGEGAARRVKVNQGSIMLPAMSRYDFLMNPANSEGYALRDEVFQPGMSAAGYLSGYATVDYNAADGMWTVVGQLKDAAKSYGGPTLGAGRTTVGKGSDVESAYRDMLSKSDIAYLLDGASSLSESRWAQIAGLMTEGRKSTGEKRLFASPPHDLDASEKALAREIGLDVKGDSVVGTMKQQRAFYERLAQKAKKTGPSSVPPFDKDAYEQVGGSEEVDEGSGAAPGSDPKRLPKPPNPKKDGPPGKEDLDKIKNLGPFERKKR